MAILGGWAFLMSEVPLSRCGEECSDIPRGRGAGKWGGGERDEMQESGAKSTSLERKPFERGTPVHRYLICRRPITGVPSTQGGVAPEMWFSLLQVEPLTGRTHQVARWGFGFRVEGLGCRLCEGPVGGSWFRV